MFPIQRFFPVTVEGDYFTVSTKCHSCFTTRFEGGMIKCTPPFVTKASKLQVNLTADGQVNCYINFYYMNHNYIGITI